MKLRAIRVIQIDLDETEFETVMLSLDHIGSDSAESNTLQAHANALHHQINNDLYEIAEDKSWNKG